MPKLQKTCVVCGQPEWRYPSEWNYSPTPICSPECRKVHRSRTSRGAANPDWKGGRYIEPGKGYVMIRKPDHPRARQNGYVLEHILVAEKMLGRPLLPSERVHHRNTNQADNRPENLKVYASNGEHLKAEGHHRPKQPPCRCGRPAVARGYCTRHYAQIRRTGRTLDLD
jgi:hypothetical protein